MNKAEQYHYDRYTDLDCRNLQPRLNRKIRRLKNLSTSSESIERLMREKKQAKAFVSQRQVATQDGLF